MGIINHNAIIATTWKKANIQMGRPHGAMLR